MRLTLSLADFSGTGKNIGTLNSWFISKNTPSGLTWSTAPSSVDKGADFNAVAEIDTANYELVTMTVTMGTATQTGVGTSGGITISNSGSQYTIYISSVTANVNISVTTKNLSTGVPDSGGNTGGGGDSTGGEGDAVNYLLNLDFTQKSFADYISDGTLGAITGTLSTTHTSEGDTFASSDVSYVALGKSLTFPTNFEIQLRMKTSEYNHIPGCGIPLFTKTAARPWIFLRGDYIDNNYDNSFGLQSRLITDGGDIITIDDVTIPCNDNAFHDVILHYEGDNVWMSVDGVKSKTATSTRNSNTVTHMFGYTATYTLDKVTLAYIKVIEL